jgi:hypothetical protein
MGHRDADLLIRPGQQAARAGGAVQVEGVADPPVPGRDHPRRTLHHDAEMADHPRVEHLVEGGPLALGAIPLAPDLGTGRG